VSSAILYLALSIPEALLRDYLLGDILTQTIVCRELTLGHSKDLLGTTHSVKELHDTSTSQASHKEQSKILNRHNPSN
jgi:hypothetical protein